MSDTPSIYDFGSNQAPVIQAYDLMVSALASRRYHGSLQSRLRTISNWLDLAVGVISSSAVASLVIWKSDPGLSVYGALSLLTIASTIARGAFRHSERLERHTHLAEAWTEIFLDFDRVLKAIRCDGDLTSLRQGQLQELFGRFYRTEAKDDVHPDEALRDKAYQYAMGSYPVEQRWLPKHSCPN